MIMVKGIMLEGVGYTAIVEPDGDTFFIYKGYGWSRYLNKHFWISVETIKQFNKHFSMLPPDNKQGDIVNGLLAVYNIVDGYIYLYKKDRLLTIIEPVEIEGQHHYEPITAIEGKDFPCVLASLYRLEKDGEEILNEVYDEQGGDE